MSTGTPPHVLYVAWGFPPCRSGGVYRALATANAFAERGWSVTVLTATREAFERYTGTDPSLERAVRPDVEVVRVPFDWPARDVDPSRWSLPRRVAPRVWRRARTALDRVPFPEVGYGPWRRRLERAALAAHARRRVDLVVATANPHVDVTAAWVLHRRHAVPFVVDERDAWLLDVFTGRQLHGDRSRAARWERAVVQAAEEVWFVNEPIARWHRERHPERADRIHVVANGFDTATAPRARTAPSPADRPLVFGYVGTVTRRVPLQEFLAGWRLARSRHPELRGARAVVHGYLGFYAEEDREARALLDAHAADGVSYAGPVPRGELGRVYDGLDALLLILGAGRYVTSGKAYEYLASALPVVAVHDPGNAATDLFRGHPRWYPAGGLSPDQVADALVAAARAARGDGPEVIARARAFAQEHSRERQLGPRVDALRRLVSGR